MPLKLGDKAPTFAFTDHTGARRDLADLSGRGKPAVLVFTRYAGCPICQLETSLLGRKAPAFAAKGASLVIVTQSAVANLGPLAALAPGAVMVSDPAGEAYRLYDVRPGTLLQYAAPAVLRRAKEAGAAGFAHGANEGVERQLPAAFVIAGDGTILWARYGRNVADAATPEELLGKLP